jgi:imidazolonepropionase-like amidohydrolase
MRKVLVGGTILDCTGAPPVRDGVLVIKGNKIEGVGSKGEVAAPPGSEIIDVEGQTVMPGLINTHDHLAHPDPTDPLMDYEVVGERLGTLTELDLLPLAIRYGRQELRDGVTTVRIMGEKSFLDFRCKSAFDSDLVPGPRIIPSGPGITTSHGHGREVSVVADGVEEVRKAVRANLREGAEIIKLFISGGRRSGVPIRLDTCYFSQDEINVAIEEAHKFGVKVAAHLNGGIGVRYAVEAGIDSIEHASLLTDSDLDLVVSSGTYIGLTILWYFTDLYRKRAPDVQEAAERNVRRFYKAGAKLVVGNDCIHWDHAMARQLELLTQFGVSRMDAILMATKNAAEACGIGDQRGTLEARKDADVIVVGGDPLSDIRALRDIRLVMKGGKVYWGR